MSAAAALEKSHDIHRAELIGRGWTIFPGAITPDQLSAGRAAIDRLIAAQGTEVHDQHYGAANLVGVDPVFADIAQHPPLLATIESLIGDDCILSSCNLGARRPGSAQQGLHRDTGIWGPSMPVLPIPVGIQTAWCFDDFTSENGATHIIPGSHDRVDASYDEPTIQLTAPAGSILAFDARAIHAGGANQTPRIRRAVLTLYIRSWLKPQTDHKRSFPPERLPTATPTLLRLLGFQRQSPRVLADGRQEIVMAPGATRFYGEPPLPSTVAA